MRLFFSLLLCACALAAQESQLDRYLTAAARRCWEDRAARVARIRTPAEVAARQRYIRAKVLEEIGGFPEKTPLHPRITGVLTRDGYRVENLIYESQPGLYVTANVYVPLSGRRPYAAVLGTAGHSDTGKAFPTYQRVWIALAKRGFLVLAYDPPGQGERIEGPGGTAEHTLVGTQCLLTGTNYARYELWGGIRAFDYLLTRKDVDPQRIAVVGNSGGGTQSAYMAVVEPRLAAAAPSCYITSWEKLWSGPGPQDAEQNFVNFLKDGLDFPDFLIAFAPRPIEMLTAIRDYFPIEGGRATYAEARRIFGVLGKADRVGFFEYDDPHGWSKPRREATYRWLEKWLHHRNDDGIEPEFETEPEKNLRCTATGQVVTSLKGETIQSLNAALAERIYARRRPLTRDIVATRIRLEGARGTPKWTESGPDAINIESEDGILVPARILTPAGSGRKPALICLDPDCPPQEGKIVLIPRPRTSGGQFKTAIRAMLVGKTMLGMQVYDVLRAFDYLLSRDDVDAQRIEIAGKGNAGVLALFVGAVEPRIAKVSAEPGIESYMEIVRAKKHAGLADIIVPGILKDFDLPDLTKLRHDGLPH